MKLIPSFGIYNQSIHPSKQNQTNSLIIYFDLQMKSEKFGENIKQQKQKVPSGIEDVLGFGHEDTGTEYVSTFRSNAIRELGHNPNCILFTKHTHFRFSHPRLVPEKKRRRRKMKLLRCEKREIGEDLRGHGIHGFRRRGWEKTKGRGAHPEISRT